MKKHILTIFVPAVALLLAFTRFGTMWGLIGLGIYILVSFVIKYPDMLIARGAKCYNTDPEKGMRLMDKALRTGWLQVDYILYYSFVLLKAGNLEKAEEVLNIAAHKKMKPDAMGRAAVNRALLLWKQGNLPKAISILEEQLKIEKNKAVYGTLGQLLILNGQLQHAMEVNQEAYVFDKYDESIVDNLALNYRLSGDLDSSWNLYKELTDKRLGVPIPYYNCGETLYAMGQKEEAVEMMEKALGYPFSKLAVVSREEIENRIAQIEAEIK